MNQGTKQIVCIYLIYCMFLLILWRNHESSIVILIVSIGFRFQLCRSGGEHREVEKRAVISHSSKLDLSSLLRGPPGPVGSKVRRYVYTLSR